MDNIQSCQMGPPPVEDYPGSTLPPDLGGLTRRTDTVSISPIPANSRGSAHTKLCTKPRNPLLTVLGEMAKKRAPSAPPPEEASHTFMAPLSRLMHPRWLHCIPCHRERPPHHSVPHTPWSNPQQQWQPLSTLRTPAQSQGYTQLCQPWMI